MKISGNEKKLPCKVLGETYVLLIVDHGHIPILDDDCHGRGVEGDDEPPALLAYTGFRMREFVLNPGETQRDYQAAVAYQRVLAYIYLADRSTCPAKGDRGDWQRPPHLEADVVPVVRAFYKVNSTGDPILQLKGTLDLIFAREPRPPGQPALPFQIFDGKRLVPIPQYLNQTTRDWYSHRPALKHRAQATKGTKVPSEPGLPGFVA